MGGRFVHLMDGAGKIQAYVRGRVGEQITRSFLLDIGDIVGGGRSIYHKAERLA